jgi:hypothetical protein
MEVHLVEAGLLSKREVGNHVPCLVSAKTYSRACQERGNLFPR